MRRRLVYPFLALMVVLGLAVAYELVKPPVFYGGVILPAKPMPDFTLHSVDGPVTLSDFRGKYVLLYFGYTSCPDLCPTTLANLTQVVARQEKRLDQVQVIFVSVDYPRDTPAKLGAYARAFDRRFIGVTGSAAEIDQVTSAYGIYYKLNTPDPQTGFYSVDHSASVLVLNRVGEIVMTWPYGMETDQMASDLRHLLDQ